VGAAALAVGTIDFDHDDALSPEVPGQTGAVGTGALDSHLPDRAMLVEPPQQLPIPRGEAGNSASARRRPTWSMTAA
jgi:hypothetical protein